MFYFKQYRCNYFLTSTRSQRTPFIKRVEAKTGFIINRYIFFLFLQFLEYLRLTNYAFTWFTLYRKDQFKDEWTFICNRHSNNSLCLRLNKTMYAWRKSCVLDHPWLQGSPDATDLLGHWQGVSYFMTITTKHPGTCRFEMLEV